MSEFPPSYRIGFITEQADAARHWSLIARRGSADFVNPGEIIDGPNRPFLMALKIKVINLSLRIATIILS